MPLKQLVSLHEVLVFELLFEELVFLLQMSLFQLPDCSFASWKTEEGWFRKYNTILSNRPASVRVEVAYKHILKKMLFHSKWVFYSSRLVMKIFQKFNTDYCFIKIQHIYQLLKRESEAGYLS